MNRRELVKMLSGGIAGIPAVKSIERLEVKPDDTLAIIYEGYLSQESAQQIKSGFAESMPGVKTLVLCGNPELRVIAKH
jgi:hypothetical protein